MKESVAVTTRMIDYQFLAFKRTIANLPPSQIKPTTEDYKESIAWDLSAGTVDPDIQIQSILNFWEFLDSNVIPRGLSKREMGFYRRTAERLIRHGFMPEVVREQFDQPELTEQRSEPANDNGVLCETI